jgi:hypothetical protein
MTADVLPAGIREQFCNACGTLIWTAPLSPAAAERMRRHLGWIIKLERGVQADDGQSNMALFGGEIVFVAHGDGQYVKHACPAAVTSCKYCGEPIRIVHQPPGAEQRLAVLDADPDPLAIMTIDGRGYAIVDRERVMPTPHYRWHKKHEGGRG